MTGQGKEANGWRAVWRRWWFHLSLLAILAPIGFLKSYIDLQALFLEAKEEGLRSVPITVGRWTVQLQEVGTEEPYWNPREGFEKQFRMVPCQRCVAEIRAMFVSLKRPGSTEYGQEFEGNPYRSFGDMRLGRNPSSDDKVWLTAEGWDGSFHQVSLPLRVASPVTAEWLTRQKN